MLTHKTGFFFTFPAAAHRQIKKWQFEKRGAFFCTLIFWHEIIQSNAHPMSVLQQSKQTSSRVCAKLTKKVQPTTHFPRQSHWRAAAKKKSNRQHIVMVPKKKVIIISNIVGTHPLNQSDVMNYVRLCAPFGLCTKWCATDNIIERTRWTFIIIIFQSAPKAFKH